MARSPPGLYQDHHDRENDEEQQENNDCGHAQRLPEARPCQSVDPLFFLMLLEVSFLGATRTLIARNCST
jgi:hypothetical protein